MNVYQVWRESGHGQEAWSLVCGSDSAEGELQWRITAPSEADALEAMLALTDYRGVSWAKRRVQDAPLRIWELTGRRASGEPVLLRAAFRGAYAAVWALLQKYGELAEVELQPAGVLALVTG